MLALLVGVAMSVALPFSNRAGMNRPVGSVFPVSGGGPVPHSRRSRGASVVRRFPAADTPLVGVSPKDLAAPVPAGAALSSGRLFNLRIRLRRQAQCGCDLIYVPTAYLPHLLRHLLPSFDGRQTTTKAFADVQKVFAECANA